MFPSKFLQFPSILTHFHAANEKIQNGVRDLALSRGLVWVKITATSPRDHCVSSWCVVFQVYVYNDHVIQGGVLPRLGDMLAEAMESLDDKVKTCFWRYFELSLNLIQIFIVVI